MLSVDIVVSSNTEIICIYGIQGRKVPRFTLVPASLRHMGRSSRGLKCQLGDKRTTRSTS